MGDSPAALGALLALHRGEPELADPLLDLAVDADLGGPALRRRHLLLRGWAALMRDDEEAVRKALGLAADLPGTAEPRDELATVALEVALARRAGETRGLLDLWSRARQALLRHPVDLYCLLPVGELAIVAARLGEDRWVEPHLAEATTLLDALGGPASWSTSWHWAGLHAAITADDRAAAAAHADALQAAVAVNDRAAAPARAARVWLAVLDGVVDAEEVAQAAAGLRARRARLGRDPAVGEAAIRTTDRRRLRGPARVRPDAAGRAGPCRPRGPLGDAGTAAGRAHPRGRGRQGPPRGDLAHRARARHRRAGPRGADLPRDRDPALPLRQDRGAPRLPHPPPPRVGEPRGAVQPAPRPGGCLRRVAVSHPGAPPDSGWSGVERVPAVRPVSRTGSRRRRTHSPAAAPVPRRARRGRRPVAATTPSCQTITVNR